MKANTEFGTIKLHFSSSRKAINASVDGSCTAGQRAANGTIKTWIAHVAKASANETAREAGLRIAQ